MTILQALILGIIQGITEWLPISSTGHTVLVQSLSGISPPIGFNVILHNASLVVILIVFWRDIQKLAGGVFRKENESLKLLLYLAIATIPIGVTGLVFHDFFESVFNNTRTIGYSLIITSVLIFLSRYPKQKEKQLTLKSIILIGIAQVIALFPGISRSGTTISAGMMQGIKKDEAAKFSFLMFIPAIVGATILELKDISEVTLYIYPLIVASVATVITGFFSAKLLLIIIRKNRFSNFGWYCMGVGLLVVIVF
jgi:undecaprenyl-diphosphatase